MRPGTHCGRYSSDLWLSVAERLGFGVTISTLWSMLVSSGLLLQYLAKIARLYICTPETDPTRLADMPEDLNGRGSATSGGRVVLQTLLPALLYWDRFKENRQPQRCRKVEASPALSMTGVTAARISGIRFTSQ